MDKQKIMLVDDDPQNSKFIVEVLSDEFELATTLSGDEALSIIDEFDPDIILLDVMMPGIDGYEVCSRIRAKTTHPHVKIILITARAMLDEKLKGYKAGADDYMTKPFQYEELQAKIKVFCRLVVEEKKRANAEMQLRNSNENLELIVKERTRELEKTNTQLKSEIVEHKKTEEKLKASEKTFRSVVESSPMGIHIYQLDTDENLVFRGANPAADRILGIDNSQFIGETIEKAFPSLVNTEVPNRYLLAAKDGIAWQTEQIDYIGGELSGAFAIHAFQMNPGHMATLFFDITERKQAEYALQKGEERFRQLAENIKEVFWIVSPDWQKVFYVSPTFRDLWQLTEDELYADAFLWFKAIVEEDREKVELFLNKTQIDSSSNFIFPEFRIARPDATERWILARGFPVLDPDGIMYRIAGIAEDITERKMTRELMIQTEKMVSLGGLAAGMAHEINNPLSAILQGAQNLERRLSPELKKNLQIADKHNVDLQNVQAYMAERKIPDFLHGIKASGQKAAKIVLDMLQFSRKSESKTELTHLANLIDNALDLAGKSYNLKKKYDFRTIEIIKEFDPNAPSIPCSESEIEQVVLNLLSNAAWAMANEENLNSPRIIIRLGIEERMIKIEIEDNGPGMSTKIRDHVFEPFFTTKPTGEGTGLGLSVSFMIITQHHKGSMSAESEVGKGTTFTIKLPLDA